MEQTVKDKIAKVYELINRGANDSEKAAAKAALDRLMKKHNLEAADVESINLSTYRFKYSNLMEVSLIGALMYYFFPEKHIDGHRLFGRQKELVLSMEYLDFVVLSASYEYFRRHMRTQYEKLVLKRVKRRRTAKTKKQTRAELDKIFFDQYRIASKLYHDGDVAEIDMSKVSKRELENRLKMQGIEGGNYSTQVTTGLYLEQNNTINENND